MAKKKSKNRNRTFEENIRLLEQSLNGAEASITMAKRILADLRSSGSGRPRSKSSNKDEQNIYEGIEGVFDGQFMVAEEGKKYQVPENYASKSLLVYGDKLKLLEEKGKQLFKQVDKVERYKTTGVLVKKDGRWAAVTESGSHKVLPASVSYYEAEEGDELVVVLPDDNRSAPFAAIQEVIKKTGGEKKSEEAPSSESKKEGEDKKEKKAKQGKKEKDKKENKSVESRKGKQGAEEIKEVRQERPLARRDEKIVDDRELR